MLLLDCWVLCSLARGCGCGHAKSWVVALLAPSIVHALSWLSTLVQLNSCCDRHVP